MISAIEERLGHSINVSEDSHYIGALGAALFAFDEIHQRRSPRSAQGADS
jgi:activator of 2-hydroxyglutaryl-CoA dehydratase